MALWNPLRGLFGGARPAAAIPDAPSLPQTRLLESAPAPAAAPEPPVKLTPTPPDRDLDRSFSGLLLAVGEFRAVEPEPAQRKVLERLQDLARSPTDAGLVPRLPAVLPKLMGLVRRDDVGPRELADQLARDPALVGEVIRIANSPRYRTARQIASLQDAVVLLGQRGMHQLVTNVAMRPVFNFQQGRFSRVAGTYLWDQAERCAHVCAYLRSASSDQFEAYLAGMVANAGLIAALRVLDMEYRVPQLPDSLHFHEALLDVAAKLSAGIARQWNFPEEVRAALETRATQPLPAAPDELALALLTADRVSKWHVLAPGLASVQGGAHVNAEGRCYQELERVFGT